MTTPAPPPAGAESATRTSEEDRSAPDIPGRGPQATARPPGRRFFGLVAVPERLGLRFRMSMNVVDPENPGWHAVLFMSCRRSAYRTRPESGWIHPPTTDSGTGMDEHQASLS